MQMKRPLLLRWVLFIVIVVIACGWGVVSPWLGFERLNPYIVLLVLCLAIAPVYHFLSKSYVDCKKKRIEHRKELMLNEIYDTYFSSATLKQNTFNKLWTEVADTLHFPAGKLRPTDRFDKELKPAHSFDQDNDDLELIANNRIYKHKLAIDKKHISRIKTLKDYVELFGNEIDHINSAQASTIT